MLDMTVKAASRWRTWRAGRALTDPVQPNPRRRAQRIAAFVGLGVAYVILGVFIAHRHSGYYDLKIYYGAINYWTGGKDLYDYSLGSLENRRYGFTYPPFAALTMLPMAVVPWWAAIVVHMTATAAATMAALYWLLNPMARRRGWDRWLTIAAAGALTMVFEPWGSNFAFGQVNMLLVGLVAADLLVLVGSGRRAAGVLIGLATAIKLTPGIFIVYLVVTRRWRAAAVASACAAAATLLTVVVAPQASREFWTHALWQPDRVGNVAKVSNQSLHGLVARLHPDQPSALLWLVLLIAVLGGWAWRARAAALARDEVAGFALTGIAGCLVSPISWLHHLVWLMPAVILLMDNAYARPARDTRQRWLVGLAWVTLTLLCSRVCWAFRYHFTDWGLLGSNAYVVLSVVLLFTLPIRRPDQLTTHSGFPIQTRAVVAGPGPESAAAAAVGQPGSTST